MDCMPNSKLILIPLVSLILFQHTSSSDRILSMDVIELYADTFQLNATVNITGFGQYIQFITYIRSNWTKQDYHLDRYQKEGRKSIYVFKRQFPIPQRGVKYDIELVVSNNTHDWSKSVTYHLAPLAPKDFQILVEDQKAKFQIVPQDDSSSFYYYKYLRINCTNLSEERMNGYYWVRNFTKSLVRSQNWHLNVPIQGDVYKAFKNGGYVDCKLSAISLRGAFLQSPTIHDSYVIEPAVPEVTSYNTTKTDNKIRLHIQVKQNPETDVFSNISLRSTSWKSNCLLTPLTTSPGTFRCKPEVQLTGVLVQVTIEVWSFGPQDQQKSRLTSIFVPANPLPPKSMEVKLVNGEMVVRLALEPQNTNSIDTLYCNRSDNPTLIRRKVPSYNGTDIKWLGYSPGITYTFSCWTSVTVEEIEYQSHMISAKYTTIPSAPLNLSAELDASGVAKFRWRIDNRGFRDGFSLTICEAEKEIKCIADIRLDYPNGYTKLEIIRQLSYSKYYVAWVEAVSNGYRSNKSNEVSIYVGSQVFTDPGSRNEREIFGLGKLIPVIIISCIMGLVLTTAAIGYVYTKIRPAGQVTQNRRSSSFVNRPLPSVRRRSSDKQIAGNRPLPVTPRKSVRGTSKCKTVSMSSTSLGTIKEMSTTYYAEFNAGKK